MESKNELELKIAPAIPLLKRYWDLLLKWQHSVNLISPNTIKEGWERHILDSAQIYFLIENQQHTLIDVGSGGGLPGIVVAILNQSLCGPLSEITLVESDLKKCLFLQECVRTLKLNAVVRRDRIENLNSPKDVVTARAFAPLNKLLSFVSGVVSRETILLLPKGKNVQNELDELQIKCDIKTLPNIVNSEGCILKIKGVQYE